MTGVAMESCSMEEVIRMHLRNVPDVMILTSTQNISEISVSSPFIHYGALTALVYSEEHHLSQTSLQRHGGLNLLSSYIRSLILPWSDWGEIWNTLFYVADYRTKVRMREFTNVKDSATNPTADLDAANCRNVRCPLTL